jgi:hypothetical protein
MTDEEKLIALLENIIADIMSDLDKKISSHSALVLSNEVRFLYEQRHQLRGKQCQLKQI